MTVCSVGTAADSSALRAGSSCAQEPRSAPLSQRDNDEARDVGSEGADRAAPSVCCPGLSQFAWLQYRHAYLLQPSQFHGEPCSFSDKEVEDCVSNRPCRSQVRCEGFVCAQTGRCVNRRLLCNGDNDCGDQSDEANCRRVYKKCPQEVEQYWAIGSLASGINLFMNSLEGPVLDHRYFAGGCSPHYILNTRFRKPYNVESFTPQKSSFLHARSDLEVARYKLKSRSLMLHYEFLQRVKQLPLEYGYGEYRDLFRDFGTHYITEAVLGGIYEYTLVMNKEAMERKGYSLRDVQECAKNGFKIGGAIQNVYVKLDVSVDKCKGVLNEIEGRNKRDTMVKDLVVLVRGGASEHITALAYKELPTADLMQEWGDAVQYNPDIIKIKAEPLYELVTAADFAYSSTVKQNMKRALEEFQKEFSSCHCAPCQGNGVPVLKESRCDCICPAGFQGPACEVTYRKSKESSREAAREPKQRHYRRLRPPVISRLHLATPGAPSSIIDHCLVPTPPSPTTSCQRGLLADKQVLSDLEFCENIFHGVSSSLPLHATCKGLGL
ncbi:complement component C8 beta chain precursor [Camelus ferus]|nr:complement component C8 beta chain precursor [Camelus ferus]